MKSFNPPSQTAQSRPIRITGVSGDCTFVVRPEDLQWTEPTRVSVQQTLAGAWADVFGPGVATIVIAGHTGWRTGMQWEAEFKNLHQVAFQGWLDYVEMTKDPESAELYFIDTLDSRCVLVIPQTFSLKRNRNRPLLAQYHITFLVVRDAGWVGSGPSASAPGEVSTGSPPASSSQPPSGGGAPVTAPTNGQKLSDALSSARELAAKIKSGIGVAQSIMNGDIGSLTAVLGEVFGREVADVVSGITGLASDVTAIIGELDSGSRGGASSSVSQPVRASGESADVSASARDNARAAADVVAGAAGALSHLLAHGDLSRDARDYLVRLIALLREVVRMFRLDIAENPSLAEMSRAAEPYLVQSADAAWAMRALAASDCVLAPLAPVEIEDLARRVLDGTAVRNA